jgi:hypothetical protein
MASATHDVKLIPQPPVIKTVEVPQPDKRVDTITLKMTPEEAQTLMDILRNVSGSPTHSRRKHQVAISAALWDVGTRHGHDFSDIITLGGVVFKAQEEPL